MTQHDPAETFRADQEAAESRDDAAWRLNIRNSEAQALGLEAHAFHTYAKARLWRFAGTGLAYLYASAIILAVLSFFGIGSWR